MLRPIAKDMSYGSSYDPPTPPVSDASQPTAAPVPAWNVPVPDPSAIQQAPASIWGAPTDNAPIPPPVADASPPTAAPVPAPDVPVADLSATQQLIPTGNLPVGTSMWDVPSDNAPIPPPAVAATSSPDTTTAPVPPSVPAPQPNVSLSQTVVPGNTGSSSSIIITVPPAVANVPVDSGAVNAAWPETPRVVAAADNLPVLPPATFGQFAVPPAG